MEDGDPALQVSAAREAASQIAPASVAQRALWFLCQTLPCPALYNEANVFRLRGALDVAALTKAFDEIVRRHDALRTRFRVVDGEPVQEILTHFEATTPLCNLSSLPEHEREAEALRRTREEVAAPFDLEQGPLMRVRLLRLARDEHWLLLTLHHIIRDGTSSVILARELSVLYGAYRAGERSPLADPGAQYVDYVNAQQEWLRGAACSEHLAYWKHALDALPVLELPLDRPRPVVSSYRGARLAFQVDDTCVGDLRGLAHSEGTTLFTVLLAALQVLLYRYSGQDDVAVGVPVAGRARREFTDTIGYFVNLLVIRGRLDGDPTFRAYLASVRERTGEAYAHQMLPFATLVQQIAPERDPSRNPLFQVALVKATDAQERPELAGVLVDDLGIRGPETAKFELHFAVAEEQGRLVGEVEYAADLFDRDTIARMVEHWRTLLADIVAQPDCTVSRLRLANEGDRRRAIVHWNPTRNHGAGERGVAELFIAQVRVTPDAMAVVDGATALTYKALELRGRALAQRLHELHVARGSRVGVCMERSAQQVVATLGVLMAGCAYIPLDPAHPPERIGMLLAAADAAAVVVDSVSQRALASAQVSSDRPVLLIDDLEPAADATGQSGAAPEHGEDLAYIMYTSGSTGEPKGVAVPHRAIVRLVRDTDYVRIAAPDVVAHLSNPAFDASTFEIWGALLNGACVAVIPRNEVLSPTDLA
ncbi:MAG TPA: condensation domain-containing protein, partial [Casimicrobiaceae bacterium]|nr:condensation domain-containing protein [Casimicrobiaceae bacterium]